MAKGFQDTASLCSRIIGDARSGNLSPLYLLMGEEAYYPQKALDAIMQYAVPEDLRDFNQSVYYGMDTSAGAVASDARSYPMMADRRLVVVKDAQNMKSLEELAPYCQDPSDSTVLVLLLRGATLDKRKALYKAISKKGVVLESAVLRDYEMERWITCYYQERKLGISPDAAALLAEYAGTDLSKIAVETDKLLKNLPEGTTTVSAADIEKNVGISRQYSIFELTKELSAKNAAKCLKIARHLAESPKFALPMVTAMLFTHFNRILKYNALLLKNPRPDNESKTKVLGVSPFFIREYDLAVQKYPLRKSMAVIALLEEYDFKGKGGTGLDVPDSGLMMELITKIINI